MALPLRSCFQSPIGSIYYSAQLLADAVKSHLNGDRDTARLRIKQADMPEIGHWLDPIWLRQSELVQPVKVVGLQPVLSKDERYKPRNPGAQMKRDLIRRDGHHCQFCTMPVIRAEVRKEIHRLYPEEARWTSAREKDQHRGLQVMWLQYDHVVVHSRGGETTIENLVVTCAACNFGRDRFSIEEMRFSDPRIHPRYPDWLGSLQWNGLEEILPEHKRVIKQ